MESTVVGVDVLGETQDGPVVVHRRRGRAAVGVDHQQVHGVRSDVEHRAAWGQSADWVGAAHASIERTVEVHLLGPAVGGVKPRGGAGDLLT